MKRWLLAVSLLLLPISAHAQLEEQGIVDRATLAVQDMMTQGISQDPRLMLSRARATLICPRVFKAGFIFAGAGGDCVMLARSGNGTWSYPAFFTIGSVSFGFQIGLQDSALVLMVMTDRGLQALLNSHFKLGADASVAIATVGGGAQGALTTGITADILAFTAARGAFAGISIEGSVLNSRTGMDQTYYGRPIDARQIVLYMQGANPGADPLRAVLTRYGSPGPVPPTPPPAYSYQPPGYAAAGGPTPSYAAPQSGYQGGYQAPSSYPPPQASYSQPGNGPIPLQPAPGPDAGIQQQNLPPPR